MKLNKTLFFYLKIRLLNIIYFYNNLVYKIKLFNWLKEIYFIILVKYLKSIKEDFYNYF